MRILKIFLIIVGISAGLLLTAYHALPWKGWLSRYIVAKLQFNNIPVDNFIIKNISTTETTVSNVTISSAPEIQIPDVTLRYDIKDALRLQFKTLEIPSLSYPISAIQKIPQQESFILAALPSPGELSSISINTIRINALKLTYEDHQSRNAHATLFVEVNSQEQSVVITSDKATLRLDDTSYVIEGIEINLISDQEVASSYRYNANIKTIEVTEDHEPLMWLPLSVSSTGVLSSSELDSSYSIVHDNYSVNAAIKLNESLLSLDTIKVDIAGGTISANTIPLNAETFETKVKIQGISLEELMQFILEDDESVKATGSISGSVPLKKTVYGFNFKGARLFSLTRGIISLSQKHLKTLPQNVEQVRNVSELLKEFMYDNLTLSTQEHNGKLEISARLQGRNPKVYHGAQVNLNINFRGDVLESLRSILELEDISHYKKDIGKK